MKIEIVTTPNETLKETGFGSIKACQSVLASIQKAGHTASLSICRTERDLQCVVDKQPDLAILAVKYLSIKNAKDIWLSEYFDNQNINYSGSLKEALEFDSNKVRAKLVLISEGVKTARFFTATPGQFTCDNELPIDFPLFLKPVDAANGNGIDDFSLVTNFDEYERKLSSLFKLFKQPVLVEEYLNGQEFTVAIIKTRRTGFYTSIIEVIPPQSLNGLRILGEKAKKEDTEAFRKTESSELIHRIRTLAMDVFRILKVRDFARIDIKINEFGECFFMEANLVPGLTADTSYFPKAFKISHDLNYDDVISLLIDGGIGRVPSHLNRHERLLPVAPSATLSKKFFNRCAELISRR